MPVDLVVAALPMDVEATAADYFVLYAIFGEGETAFEHPVSVTLGRDGLVTIDQTTATLPADRFRVEKYLRDVPGDVDGDCVDDMTELANPVTMSPVNAAAAIDRQFGGVAIPDAATFDAFAHTFPSGVKRAKYIVFDLETAQPKLYLQDTNRNFHHARFLTEVGDHVSGVVSTRGALHYDADMLAPDGSRGMFWFEMLGSKPLESYERLYSLLAANMGVVDNNLALWIKSQDLRRLQDELPEYRASGMHLVFDDDLYGSSGFAALNEGEGFGLLRHLDADDRPNPGDVVIYESLPNELPRVAGIISTVPQTPLSHINLRAVQSGVPNAYVRDALDDAAVSDLLGSVVYYAVTDSGYILRAATQAEADAHFAALRPAQVQVPERDFTVTSITPLSGIGFDDWDAFGVKAANLAVLATLDFEEGTVPDGFAVPFYFYDEFMKHNGFYDDVRELLGDPEFRSDFDTQQDKLKKLRKKIKKADTPEWIETALTEMHASFSEGTSLRYRSSTNNEDLPGFNGAGLYDSKTQHPDETEEDGIAKSLKQVYASLWNYRAFVEREFHNIDHLAAAMGVLVHPNFSDELANGVAVSADPAYGTEGTFYVNTQLGEDLVTNPEAQSVPEELLLGRDGSLTVVATSNLMPAGQMLFGEGHRTRLREYLAFIHRHFARLYGVGSDDRFAMEIEFKITSDDRLSIKQARPWIFADPQWRAGTAPAQDAAGTAPESELTASVVRAPALHDGDGFYFDVHFSEHLMTVSRGETLDASIAVSVTGGRATSALLWRNRSGEFWRVWIEPHNRFDAVTFAIPNTRPCAMAGTACSYNGQRLAHPLAHTVPGRAPLAPDRPVGVVLGSGAVKLEWNNVDRALSYDLELLRDGRWVDLPADGVDVAFDGAGATVTGLDANDTASFRVRSVRWKAASPWSAPLVLRRGWAAELFAEVRASQVPVMSGYTMFSGDSELSEDEFWLGGDQHQVKVLAHGSESLYWCVGDELPVDFVLRVGGAFFVGSESLVQVRGAGLACYWWPAERPGWAPGTPMGVGLTVYLDVLLASRDAAPVTAHFDYFPDEHDGSDDVTLQVYFSEPVTATAQQLRDEVLAVSGGEVSSVAPVGGARRIWSVSVTPHGRVPVSVSIRSGVSCELAGAICSDDGSRLWNDVEVTVPAKLNHAPTGRPVVRGVAEVGETLTVDTSQIADRDGTAEAVFAYQWISTDDTDTDIDIAGATEPSYTVTAADEGRAFKVKVSFTDDDGNAEALTSQLLRARPYGLAAVHRDGSVELSWERPAGWPRLLGGYRILRMRPELGETEPAHLAWHDGPPTYVDADVTPGVLYEYRVQIVSYNEYSPMSKPAQARASANPETPTTKTPTTGELIAKEPTSVVALTAEFSDGPATHDGNSAFTLELVFSQEPRLSYLTLRDHALEVTAATITGVQRLTRGSNTGWQITVAPHSDTDVSITLPATTDCADQGAVCTSDGNKLSKAAAITIPGPSAANK